MKKFLLLIICAVVPVVTRAEKVSEQEALQKAQQFLQGKKIKQDYGASRRLRRAPKTNVTSDAYYVFNVEDNGGFVIVSSDDRTEEILGYAVKGTFDVNNLPDNMKTWLGVYETAIKSIANKSVKLSQRRIITHETIEPLLDCQWGQGAPYNSQCPISNEQNCVTGCVATAMAQLMYYHNWPENVGAMDSYDNSFWGFTVPELPSTTFNWSQMKACYTENESADEVAKLMRYCGQAVEMQYGIYESGVSSFVEIDKVLTDVFDYDKSIRVFDRGSFVNTSWQEMIYRELADKRPVYYDAFNGYNAGHAFLCDGYDNGYFHINWGWNGDCDGYFLLSILDPDNTDDPMNAYSVGQRAFVNVRKNSGYGTNFDDGCFVYRIIDEDKVWLYSTTDFDPYEWHDEKPYDRKADSIIIPSIVTHEGRQYKVTNLGHEYAINIHWDNSYIQTERPPVRLVLPETLEQIDEINFYGPDEITIPKNVYTIGPQGIYGQEPLKRILVEEGNEFFKSIDGVLYSKDGKTICVYPQGKAIETLYVAEGVKTIAAKAFAGCFLIKHIVLPESVEGEIPAYTFNGCGSLESISLPDGITSIGAVAFDGCFRLKHIDLPKNLKFIGPFSFMDCPLLEEITIPGTVEAIACEAFRTTNDFWTNYPLLVDELGLDGQHSMLRKITVQSAYPIEVYDGEPFDDYVYENATLYVPTGSKEFYQAAPSWKNFKHIEEIDMPDAVMQKTSQFLTYSITGENTVTVTGAKRELYGHLTLPTTVDIDNKEYNITGLEQSALINQAFSWLTIPDGFESIGYNAVGQNWNLTRIDLPSTTKYDGYYFIYDNPSLAEITLAEGNPYFTLKDGVLYTKDMATLVAHPAMLKDKELIIPNGVTRLEMFSLADCKYLEDVTIPNTVQEMPCAFYGLSQDVSIKSITVQRKTPPEGWSMFDTPDNAIIDNATLYVPTGCKAVYQEHPEWGKFKHIEEKDMPEASSSTILASNYSRFYGDPNPSFDYSLTGIMIEGTPDISCNATTSSPVGVYDIIISKGSVVNDDVAYINGKLIINPAPLTITAKNYAIKQGDLMPIFEVNYDGFKNEETSAVLTKQPIVTTNAPSTNDVGLYTLTPSGAEAQNYTINYIDGNLSIWTPGDANGDGSVDVGDAVPMVSFILDDSSDKTVLNAYDLNNDQVVDVFDITKLINMILIGGKNPSPAKRAMVESSKESEDVFVFTDGNIMHLDIKDANRFTAFQMDIEVPNGAALEKVVLTDNQTGHSLRLSKIGGNHYRVVGLSMRNAAMQATNDGLLNLFITGNTNGELYISNIKFFTPMGERTIFNSVQVDMTTGIRAIETGIGNSIYDLAGRKINGNGGHLTDGIYIVNGKKEVVIKK